MSAAHFLLGSFLNMPSATGQNWEKYQKKFADDEEPEKKITPLTDEFVILYHR